MVTGKQNGWTQAAIAKRRATCERKRWFATEADALATIADIAATQGIRPKRDHRGKTVGMIGPYACEFGDHWHIGNGQWRIDRDPNMSPENIAATRERQREKHRRQAREKSRRRRAEARAIKDGLACPLPGRTEKASP